MSLAGSVIGWFVILPVIYFIGQYAPDAIGLADVPIAELDHWGLWTYYLKYIGIGSVVMGGFISLFKAIPIIVRSFKGTFAAYKLKDEEIKRTDRNVSPKLLVIAAIIILGIIAFLPVFPNAMAGSLGAILVLIFGFIFVTVSAHLVGFVGSSNNPIVAMSIGGLLVTAVLFRVMGFSGTSGAIAIVIVGSIICICIGVSGDMAQDLKTGFLLGATPRNQQYGQTIGVITSAAVMGAVIIMLDKVYTIGSEKLAAPHATMIKSLAEGVMEGNLPWSLILIGMGIAVAVWLMGGEVLPFSVGLYLPIHLSVTMMIGGAIRGIIDSRKKYSEETRAKKIEKGTMYASGYIAGDALIGVVATVLIYLGTGVDSWGFLDFLRTDNAWVSFALFLIVIAYFAYKIFSRSDEDKLDGRDLKM